MSKNKNKNITPGKFRDKNIIGGLGILIFCIFFISMFALKFVNSDSPDQSRRYCADCSLRTGTEVYHSVDNNTETDEIWCENCNKWHAPKNEDLPASVK